MKKLLLILIVLLFGVVSSASAQIPSKPFSLYLDAGLQSVSSPDWFKDIHKLGYHAEGGIGFKAFPFIELVGKVGINVISKDWDYSPELSEYADGGNVKIMTYGIDARASIGAPLAPFKPFMLVGIGMAKVSEDGITVNDGDLYYTMTTLVDQTKLYYNFGGGIEFGGGPVKLFIQARYVGFSLDQLEFRGVTKPAEKVKYMPISFGIKF